MFSLSSIVMRRRMVQNEAAKDPSLLAMALTGAGLVVLLGVCVVAMAGLPAFGFLRWTFVAVLAIWAWLGWGHRWGPARRLMALLHGDRRQGRVKACLTPGFGCWVNSGVVRPPWCSTSGGSMGSGGVPRRPLRIADRPEPLVHLVLDVL
jgi:hypothetical protein